MMHISIAALSLCIILLILETPLRKITEDKEDRSGNKKGNPIS